MVTLITTQQGAEIRAEVERWSPADAVKEVDIHGLAPTEGRELVASVVGHPPTDDEWELVLAIGELVGWHPEALRLAAIESRVVGWQGTLGELRAARIPWIDIRRLVMRQWGRLHPYQRAWLNALIARHLPGDFLTNGETAQTWGIDVATADRRLWILKGCGLIAEESSRVMDCPRWRVNSITRQVLIEDG